MLSLSRRKFIQGAAAYGLAASFFLSNTALAKWPSKLFSVDKKKDFIKEIFGDAAIEESALIQIKAPEIAENGAVVPVSVQSSLPNVESVSILVDQNPRPLAAQFVMRPANRSNIATRLKLAESSQVIAVVKSDGKLYSSTKNIKVTIGGCGG
ncbi:MAG: thiosulfate oxidation carrier protein SoxY [Gammaproteobacteria bacterium]|jgi:sulfur-oxidizing protein SoxY|nr:thiosulfate oxidation carrier protein SoxY [Gammaproteobacteria bacterium]